MSHVSFDSLESYKSQTDSATVVPEPMATNCDEKHGDATSHEVDTVASSMEQLVDTAPLEVTVEWQDAETGTMMGFLLCDDASAGLQEARELFGEEDEADYSSEASTGDDSQESRSSSSSTPSECLECQSPSEGVYEIELANEEAQHDVPEGFEKWDAESNAVLAYAICDDAVASEAIAAGAISADELVQELFEYEDEMTSTALGYAVCDEFLEEQAVQLGLICGGDHVAESDNAVVSDAASSESE